MSGQEGTVTPIHDAACDDWACIHCTVCGVGVVFGSRCHDHPLRSTEGEGGGADG